MNSENQIKESRHLLLDIGNTNLKWAWLRTAEMGDVTTACHKESDIAALATEKWSNEDAPSQVYISCVAGQAIEDKLADWCKQYWDLEPLFVKSVTQACGVINSYSEPERLGVDRWLSMIALHVREPGPTCIVDCGTAVTIDAIGLEGKHLGGLILPGFSMMLQSLTENTSITFENAVKSDGLLATDTETAVAAGGVLAVAALVEQIQQEVAAEYGVTVDLVLTGGDAEILRQAIRVPSRIESDLVLHGLVAITNNEAD